MIDKIIAKLTELHPTIPVYGDEITEEELKISKSYFIYRNTNQIRPGTNGRGLYRTFLLFYITVERNEIDIATLVTELSDGTGLTFRNSDEDFGKIGEEDKTAFMVTMNFGYPVRKC